MSAEDHATCCPRFEPKGWDKEVLTWEGRKFVKDRVRSFLHVPLNFGAVMKRNAVAIDAAGARPEQTIVLSDENSLWGADLYIEVTKDVPGAVLANISGTFLSKVYEGPYRNMRAWIEDMKTYVAAQGRELEKMYFFYTTCPKCAKTYGKNYVVILAKV
jgi:hypothetical protein